jgi:hypothetical protein
MATYYARRVAPLAFEVPELPAFPPLPPAVMPPADQPSRRIAADLLRGERAADVARWNARRGFV